MSLIADLKRKTFLRKLRKALANQGKQAVLQAKHPTDSKVLSILFPADNADDRKLVEDIKTARQKKGLETHLLGFFSSTVAKDASYNFPYYSPKDLSWSGVPAGEKVNSFLSENSDMLYVLGAIELAHFHYIGQVKRASLKVGPFTEEGDSDNFYNVQYMTKADAPLKEKLKQIDNIFKIINAKKTA